MKGKFLYIGLGFHTGFEPGGQGWGGGGGGGGSGGMFPQKINFNWGEPEQAPHYRGLREHEHRPTDRAINRPTGHVRPIHVILVCCTCTRCQAAMPHS